jgi:hypothetical protein
VLIGCTVRYSASLGMLGMSRGPVRVEGLERHLSVAAVVPCAWLFPVEWLLFDVVSGLDEPPGRLDGAGGAGVSSAMPGRLERFKLITGLGEFPQAWRRGTGGSRDRHRCNCL